MKKYFAHAFIIVGMLVSMVSCAPAIRAPFKAAGTASLTSEFSFLGAAMLLALASLCMVVGVLLHARSLPATAPDPAATEVAGRIPLTLVAVSPLTYLVGVPMGHLLIPLWALSRGRTTVLKQEAARVLNFQITWTLFAVVALLLCVVIGGVFFLAALVVFHAVVTIRAAWLVWRGRSPTYPLSVKFVG
ncbi:MAG: DUF4870 domain-containing protein [Proteobacteria bacterium]|nr:MAG: DUF4870 domain-containing protein [Pseudomonadota bacterium]